MTLKQIQSRLRQLGLINNFNEPILYNKFKNRATIHTYKTGCWSKRVVFIGVPNVSLFGFYSPFEGTTDTEIMKEAYSRFERLVKGNMSEFEVGAVQWGRNLFKNSLTS